MSKDQLKTEINQILNQLSDNGLNEILRLLKKLDAKHVERNEQLLEKILKEDHSLLKRLAQ